VKNEELRDRRLLEMDWLLSSFSMIVARKEKKRET